MRWRSIFLVGLVGLVLVGVVVLIVVEVAAYDGRTPAEIKTVERVEDWSSLRIDALNSLPPAVPLPEGEYACPEAEGFYMLIGLRYAGAPEVQLAIAPAGCVGTTVLDLKQEVEFGASSQLMRLLDRLLGVEASA